MQQRITNLILRLKPDDSFSGVELLGFATAPYLQGVLMERINSNYAELLHNLPFNPYSQHCVWSKDDGMLVWKISALTNESAEYIIPPLSAVDFVHIKALNANFHVMGKTLDFLDLKTLASGVYEEGPSRIRVDFRTPTAFKSKGEYVFMPSTRHLFQNLLMRYEYVYEGNDEPDEGSIAYLEKSTRIVSYRLHSHHFDHAAERRRGIPAFMGSVTLGLGGSPTAAGLARMLLKFGEYSGVGIKTSMGMGAMTCVSAASRR